MSKRKVVLGTAAVALLVGLITVPSFAAAQKTVKFELTSATSVPVNTVSPGATFNLKLTNTTPGSSNPSSFRVTVPTSTTPQYSGTGFQITGASINQGASNNGNNSSAWISPISADKTYVDFNNVSPVQSGQYIVVTITATTPSICPDSSATSSTWNAQAYTGSTVGQAQKFTQTNTTTTTLTAASCPAAPGAFSISANKTSFIPGDAITLTATAVSGTPTPTITWQYSATAGFSSPTNLSPTGSTYSISSASASDARYYRAVASNGVAPDSTSNVIQLVQSTLSLDWVNSPTDALKTAVIGGTPSSPVSVQFKVDGSDSGAFEGTGVTITNSGSGTGTLSGNTATLDSSGLATFPNLSIDTSGDYSLTASVDGSGPSTGAVTITISDGILGCSAGNNTASTTGVTVVRLPNADNSSCVLIPYILERDGNQISFLKDLSVQTEAQFKITVDSWDAENAVNPLPATQVDTPGPGFHDIQWCTGTSLDPSILPGSEVTCLLDQSAAVQSDGKVKVNETYYLHGDILYKR